MTDLVMRLETAAAKCDAHVKASINTRYYRADAADMRELLQEAARRIKELEHSFHRKLVGEEQW
jgi:hypothetical protein